MSLLNYQSQIPKHRLAAAQRQEAARQELARGEATEGALAYARYLSATGNDATLSHGKFKQFAPDDEDVARNWPFLVPLISRT